MLAGTCALVRVLPCEHAGCAVLGPDEDLFQGGIGELRRSLDARDIRFRSGSIRGVLPTVREV